MSAISDAIPDCQLSMLAMAAYKAIKRDVENGTFVYPRPEDSAKGQSKKDTRKEKTECTCS